MHIPCKCNLYLPCDCEGPDYEDRGEQQEGPEVLMVTLPHTGVQPGTVVVMFPYTLFAVLTVLTSHWLLP